METTQAARALHDKAVNANPINDGKPTTIKAAIVKPGKTVDDHLTTDDFLWIKCPAKITVAKIREQYDTRRQGSEPWVLKHSGRPVNLSNNVGFFNTYGDNVVVFEAVNVLPDVLSDTPQQQTATQSPLSPKDVNAQKQPSVPAKSLVRDGADENPTTILRSHTPSSGLHPRLSAHNTSPHSANRANSRTQSSAGERHPAWPQLRQWQPPAYGPPTQTPSLPPPMQPANRQSNAQFGVLVPPNASEQSKAPSDRSNAGRLSGDYRTNPPISSNTIATKGTEEPATAPNMAHARPTPTFQPEVMDARSVDGQRSSNFQLQSLVKDAAPQVLESAVEASVELLNDLRKPLENKVENSPDAQQWMHQIDALKKQAVKTKTIIGVVGNTGAGKSSVINAMLEEERLVPTNCMRACTACVTEIAYNYEEEHLYSALIEFISAADWEKELRVLFQDLLDGEGKVSRECTNEDSDAGIAYAKIKAVYPHKSKEDIAHSSIQSLLGQVSHILGTNRNIKENDSLMFYRKLQSFVDSKEKSTGKKEKQKKEREFWPLIKVVRLYVRSPALKTGAVIVDLPGVHDSNAARAAVAEGYMKQCTGLWIVAPINRAVDDKAAKSLLGESFKRQLKMDGGFSSVTFICSKTDDISLTEAQDSLGLEEELGPSWDELDNLTAKRKHLTKQMEDMKETKAVYEEVANDADEQLEVWESLMETVSDGKVAYAPTKQTGTTKKRKGGRKEKPAKKKRRIILSDEEDSEFEDAASQDASDSSDGGESSDQEGTREPLTEDQVSAKVHELKATKKDSRGQKKEVTEKISAVRKQIGEIKDAEAKFESKLSELCISGRNEYSKGAIQQDFAAGIKELDQEIAAEEDEDSFNPDNDVRDYEEVARSLPVFCVSSRGYQKLQGRFRKEPAVPGFSTVEETEIPALQAHCEKLTETGRAANCRSFINKLSQLLNSLNMWASNDGTGANLTAEQKAKEARFLNKGLDGLETTLERTVKGIGKELRDELADNVNDKHETAVSTASRDSITTTQHWGSGVNREDRAAGGLYWSTYKAICRRDGVYTNAQGLHDWNVELASPIIKAIASGWEKIFSRRIGMVFNNFARHAPAALKKFHREIEMRAQSMGTGVAQLAMLSHQVNVYEQLLKDVGSATKEMIMTRQKDVNREYVPVIQQAMEPVYLRCVEECGTGSFARMKAHMNSHVAEYRDTMFQRSVSEVERQLHKLVEDAEHDLDEKTDEVFIQMKRDYRSVLGCEDVPHGQELPKAQRQMRREIKHLTENVEKRMRQAVGLEVEEDRDEASEEERKPETRQVDGASDVGSLSPSAQLLADESKKSSEEVDNAIRRNPESKLESSNEDMESEAAEGSEAGSIKVDEEEEDDDEEPEDDELNSSSE